MKIDDLLPIEGLELDPEFKHHPQWPDYWQARLRSPDGLVWIDVDLEEDRTLKLGGSGHTHFRTKLGDRTFDRHGVEDSFYLSDWDRKPHSAEELRTTLMEQLARARKSIARYDEAVPVPGLPGGFSLTPAELAERRAALQKNGYVRFTPGGFGTGYTVSKRKGRWAHKAKPELIEFFGMGTLYVETFDHD